MKRSALPLALAGFLVAGTVAAPLRAQGAGGGDPFLDQQLLAAREALVVGAPERALREVERALERDDRHLGVLLAWADAAEALDDLDTAVYALHRWLSVADAAERGRVDRKVRKAVEERLAALDPDARRFRELTADYLKELARLEKDYSRKKRYHSALAVLEEILHLDPHDARALARMRAIRREGGADVAVEDLYAGSDPLEGVDPEWLAEEDPKHLEWEDAWVEETENYRVRTNAGYLVLKTAAIAMEQMNRAYRQFFRYELDGDPTPRIDVHIFKTRDEYLTLGKGPPVKWSAGHFTGDAVETYVSGGDDPVRDDDSIRGMYHTLFHEAAHQFVALTGRGGVPGWLNEAYASFFEGTIILSNGSVKWNQVNPGRLFALAKRMDQGWMSGPSDGVRDESGEWATPPTAPTLEILIRGEYEWGPPWYAPTWGVVYFLYNWRDPETGRAVLRDPLHEYYLSGAAHVPSDQRVEHFESIVLAAPEAPARSVAELNGIWRDWILRLRDAQLGKGEAADDVLAFADAALERGDVELAAELYEQAFQQSPSDPEILWKQAEALRMQKEKDRAAALYRGFVREMELRGRTEDPRLEEARRWMVDLDPLARRQAQLKRKLAEDGLALARRYRERGMPLMAMEIARRMSASWSVPEALELYAEVARETGKSLARWKLAYDEYGLDGWSHDPAFSAYGKVVRAWVEMDPALAEEGAIMTHELAYDTPFEGDFSIEAELRLTKEPTMAGLCFGRKDQDHTHAVLLHTKGFLDVATKNGAEWTLRDHLQVPVDPKEWTLLRIDVVAEEGDQAVVDLYLEGRWLRSVRMPRQSVRGAFGLIAGTGGSEFRNVRVLARDPYDPAARIERELARKRLEEDESLRTPGVFLGFPPPEPTGGTWLQGGPVTLAERRGLPTLIAFWTLPQEEAIPTADYYARLAEDYAEVGLQVVLIHTNEKPKDMVAAWLENHPLPGVAVLWDDQLANYHAYHVGADGWELPRIVIVDVDGRVAWEGDPNLAIGAGWDPEDPTLTPVDTALDELTDRRGLWTIADHRGDLEKARRAWSEGRLAEATALLAPLAAVANDFHPAVLEARDLLAEVEAVGRRWFTAAEAAAERGRVLHAARLWRRVAEQFPDLPLGKLAAERAQALERGAAHRAARRLWGKLERAALLAERGRDAAEIRPLLEEAGAGTDPDLLAAVRAMEDALYGEAGVAGVPAALAEAEAALGAATVAPAPLR